VSDDPLDQLHEALGRANGALVDASKLVKHTELDYSVNFHRIADALAIMVDLYLAIGAIRPDLIPDHLKADWNSPAPPDAVWRREE
jgi:hypothetical protein